MMRCPKDARKAFEKLKRLQTKHISLVEDSNANYVLAQLAFSLGIGLRRTKRAVDFLKAYGFATPNLEVPDAIKGLSLSRVSIDSGENLLKQKEQRRIEYFRAHGSMKTSSSEIARSIRLVPKPFKD